MGDYRGIASQFSGAFYGAWVPIFAARSVTLENRGVIPICGGLTYLHLNNWEGSIYDPLYIWLLSVGAEYLCSIFCECCGGSFMIFFCCQI